MRPPINRFFFGGRNRDLASRRCAKGPFSMLGTLIEACGFCPVFSALLKVEVTVI
jgi:hypothetical protein